MKEHLSLPEIIEAVENMKAKGNMYEKKLAELFYAANMQQLLKLKSVFIEELKKFL